MGAGQPGSERRLPGPTREEQAQAREPRACLADGVVPGLLGCGRGEEGCISGNSLCCLRLDVDERDGNQRRDSARQGGKRARGGEKRVITEESGDREVDNLER